MKLKNVFRGGCSVQRFNIRATMKATVALVIFALLGSFGAAALAALTPHALSERFPGAALHYLPARQGEAAHWLIVSADKGVVLLDEKYQQVTGLAETAELLSVREAVMLSNQSYPQDVIATVLEPGHIPAVIAVDRRNKRFTVSRLPAPEFQIENLCLQRDSSNNLFLYLLDERGTAEHWLVADSLGKLQARHVRNLPIPPNSKACSVDDQQQLLYVAEEEVGLWAYSASPEASPGRRAIDLDKPFGQLHAGTEAIAAVPGGVLAISIDDKQLRSYRVTGKKIEADVTVDLSDLDKPEGLSAYFDQTKQQLSLLIYNDDDGKQYAHTLPWHFVSGSKAQPTTIASVTAEVQTAPMSRFGDAADDPAIWVHSKDARKSLVLGTNKREGLFVYDLQGREVQSIPSGRINNVDVRYGLKFGRKIVDLAMTSLRDDNSLVLYTIDRKSGKVTESGKIPTNMKDIYGFCMYQPVNASAEKIPSGDIYAIVNDKSGEFQQFLITSEAGRLGGKLVRTFHVESQPEGCVANDRTRELFVGEEDVAVWVIGADPDAGTVLREVIRVGNVVVDDIEGLGIYQGKKQDYLIISSQGNNSYVVTDATAPYAVRGIFRVELNAEKGIDAVSETDGLEVTHHNLGGVFSEGMLVVQDGHKVMPETPQNFKYVSWRSIREALSLD
jgi:3-phytase